MESGDDGGLCSVVIGSSLFVSVSAGAVGFRWYPGVDERRHETKPVERSVATELQVWVAYANPNTEWIEASVGASPADGGGV